MRRNRARIEWVVLASLACAAQNASAPSPALSAPTKPPPTHDGRRAVSGTVFFVHHYCATGGAAVTDQMWQEASGKEPRAASYRVVAGGRISGEPPLASFASGADGHFELRLPAGTYCAYAADRQVPPPRQDRGAGARPPPSSELTNSNMDAQCLEAEARRCDAIFEVGEAESIHSDIEVMASCPEPFNQPCYRGPMPP